MSKLVHHPDSDFISGKAALHMKYKLRNFGLVPERCSPCKFSSRYKYNIKEEETLFDSFFQSFIYLYFN